MLVAIYINILKSIWALSGYSSFFAEVYYIFANIYYYLFSIRKIKKNTVLITDPVDTHGEVMPGVIKYCLDLGYNVEVAITDRKAKEKPLKMFKNIKVFVFDIINYKKLFASGILNKYEKIISTSTRVYYDYKIYKERFMFDFIKDSIIEDKKFILIEHHLDLLTDDMKSKYKCAGLPYFSENFGIKVINPHYFGKYKLKNKNKITHFVIAGTIKSHRKNINLLFDVLDELEKKGIDNYKITIIGEKGDFEIDNKHVSLLGRINYSTMYNILAGCDFIIPLFDPNVAEHKRYITIGTSGIFQLIYGFLKPAVIEKTFSNPHKLDSSNSIVYSANESLPDAVIKAIKMDNNEYKKIQNNLKNTEKELYNISLNNIKNYLEEIK